VEQLDFTKKLSLQMFSNKISRKWSR